MGANGAGKSTLAKIAAGVVEPDNGQIFVMGKEVRLSAPRVARQNGIVIVHQATHELGAPGLSVAENLVLDGLCAGTFGALAGKREIERSAKTVALALFTGAVIGLVNGLLIVWLRIPDLLATLGMMFLLAGLQLIPSAGRSITIGLNLPDGSVANGSFDPAFLALGRYKVWAVCRCRS
jgi:simple sugar transport system permease protein